MDKLKTKKCHKGEFSQLEALLNFMKLGEFAYGVPDVIRSPLLNESIPSVHSAYEVQEDLNRSRETVLELEQSGYTTPESLHSGSPVSSIDYASSTSGSFDLPPSDSQIFLSGLLKNISTASNESISSACFKKLNSPKTKKNSYRQNTSISSKIIDNDKKALPMHGDSLTAPKIYDFLKTASFDDGEIAQVVHDLVFERYEESYTRLLNKLKKLHLSEEENKFRNVVAELETVFNKNNGNRQKSQSEDNVRTSSSLETCSIDSQHFKNATASNTIQSKILEVVNKIYSSTDSDMEHEVKPIGIPQSGKLDRTLTKTTYSTVVNMEPVSPVSNSLNIKKTTSKVNFQPEKYTTCVEEGIKNVHKYTSVPQITKNSLSCPIFNVEAQVYAVNVEGNEQPNQTRENATSDAKPQQLLKKRKSYDKSLDLQNAITNLDENEEITNNSLYPSVSPLVRTATNKSHESEYNEYNFLRAALGDELLKETSSNEYMYPQTISIATDDVSELLSSTSSIAQIRRRRCRNRKSTETISSIYDRKSLSLCNTVLQKAATYHKNSSTLDGSGSFVSYEDITNFNQSISINQSKKLIKNKIFVHENIIDQAERALDFGRRKYRHFIGSPAHLEAERTLLVSKIRRQTLINTLYTIQDTPSETLGRITIENLRCILNSIRNNHHSLEQYYVCILQHKTTVYSTRIAAPNRLGWIDFGGCFIFDNVTNTFNIKIELHGIQVSQTPQNCFIFPFLRSGSKLPMMKLIGETYIGIMNRKNDKFSLLYREGERFREHKLTASIQTSIKWPDTLRGYLTVGIEKQEHQPIWNRRWCVLEKGKLKYYNYPSDENYCKPVGTLDLETCKCCDETYRRYLRQKTLALFIDSSDDFKIYYLSPDTTEEFNLWRKNVEVILRLIKEWNMF